VVNLEYSSYWCELDKRRLVELIAPYFEGRIA
jgi:hypothetical protein